MKRKIVVSAVNIISGGALSILGDCLSFLQELTHAFDVIVLVHDKNLVSKELRDRFEFFEFPNSKKSWFFRCYYEYVYFYFLSKKIKPFLWLSLHDMTPNVKSERLAVYCHNPAPFCKIKKENLLLDKKFTLFSWFYKYLYAINIRKNDAVIVQQQWMRNAFKKMYRIQNVVVARPNIDKVFIQHKETKEPNSFIYPIYPRIFKNIEVIGEALKEIDDLGIKVFVTIDGSENAYAKKIVKKYNYLKSLVFVGFQTREAVFDYFNKVDALIFPSKLETWGMPMSEFAVTGKPIFASDLPFAHETLVGYHNVKFFHPDDSKQLAKLLKKVAEKGKIDLDFVNFKYEAPYAKDWRELFNILLK